MGWLGLLNIFYKKKKQEEQNKMEFSPNGVKIIEEFEGFVPHPYKDVVGVPTIGYGTTFYPDGRTVTMNDSPITKQQGEEMLINFVNKLAIPVINQHVKVDLNQNQIDSLCSFIYNLGTGAFIGSHLLIKINSKSPCSEIKDEFNKWVYAGHKVNEDLVQRRKKEADLYCS